MTLLATQLLSDLNRLFTPERYQDYGPNGLQIEGKDEISRIAYAVSATKESIDKAVAIGADALIVHHGLFWKFHGAKPITGAFARRIKPLLRNEINLIAYHLPLDGHPLVGNAAAIAGKLKLTKCLPFGGTPDAPYGIKGELPSPVPADHLKESLSQILGHEILHAPGLKSQISSIGIITGGANKHWQQALDEGLDSYLTGEISEHDWHEAQESGLHYFAGGHNATESFGIQSLLEHLFHLYKDKGVEHFYIPSSNPA